MTQGPHVLMVDDAEDLLLVGDLILSTAGFRVTTCASGEEALHLCAQPEADFDVILMDLRMPGMSGDEVIQHLRRMPHIAGTPIVLVSAEARYYAGEDIDDCLEKPYTYDTLVATVRRVLAQGRPSARERGRIDAQG